MSKTILASIMCAAAAVAAKILPTHFAIARRVDQDTHREVVALNDVAFWCLLAAAAVLFIFGVILRIRRGAP